MGRLSLQLHGNENKTSSPHDNNWYISSFPIIREESCEFRHWKRVMTTLPVVTNAKSKNRKSPQQQRFVLASKTNRITIENSSTSPTGIHISVTNQPNKIRIHFTTGSEGPPLIMYGTNESSLNKFQIGTSDTYKASDMCQSPANLMEAGKFTDPGMLHTVILDNLDPDTRYWYKVGIFSDGQKCGDDNYYDVCWSDLKQFITEPHAQNYSLIVYGDQGAPSVGWDGGYLMTANLTSREVIDGDARIVHIIGDLSYANGAGHVWDSYMEMIEPFAAHVPLMAGVGNHEYGHSEGGQNGKDPSGLISTASYHRENDSGGECGVPFSKRFHGSGNGNGVFWYSYDYGSVHTTVISSEHDLSEESEQYIWLKMDLMSVNRTKTPWIIVECHRPMYMLSKRSPKGRNLEDNIGGLLIDRDVDMFISGHRHIYFRSCQ
mmetsp:Transcript_20846/g.25810  ORF Transcript_20846/g.25810 Transcript_20846/m.25810 type:complete len:433 (+) Transcript_20846:5-1303(+)